MNLISYMPSFEDELVKIALQEGTVKERVDQHFKSTHPDWDDFERGLRSQRYQKLVKTDPRADAKLKRYVNNYGGYLKTSEIVGKVRSKDSGRTYAIKRLKNGRLACGCGDWQYARSHAGQDCKHIRQLHAQQLIKKAGVFRPLGVMTTSGLKNNHRYKKGQLASAQASMIVNAKREERAQS